MEKTALVTGTVLTANDETIEKYQTIKNCLTPVYKEVNTPLETMDFKGTPAERYARAVASVNNADFVIADVSYPSTGQGMELMLVKQLEKPIILIAQKGSKVSGLIKGAFGEDSVFFYENNLQLSTFLRTVVKNKTDKK